MMMGACSSDEPTGNSEPFAPMTVSSDEARTLAATSNASMRLIKSVDAKLSETSPNYVFSPLSVLRDVAVLTNAAGGQTRAELTKALGMENGEELAALNSLQNRLKQHITGADSRTTVKINESVWTKSAVSADFKNLAEPFDIYYGTLGANATDNQNRIDAWVNDATEGLITGLPDNSSASANFSLLNALYFQAPWKEKAEEKTGVFKNADRTPKNVKMFEMDHCREVATPNATVVSARYGNGAFQMTVVLPDEGITPSEIVAGLTDEEWAAWQYMLSGSLSDYDREKYEAGEAKVRMPEWDVRSVIELEDVLAGTGFEAMFAKEADFSALTGNNLTVDFARQTVRIITDREGTKAASVTEIGGFTANFTDLVIVDRPFFYTISETSTGQILFAGVVSNL